MEKALRFIRTWIEAWLSLFHDPSPPRTIWIDSRRNGRVVATARGVDESTSAGLVRSPLTSVRRTPSRSLRSSATTSSADGCARAKRSCYGRCLCREKNRQRMSVWGSVNKEVGRGETWEVGCGGELEQVVETWERTWPTTT